MRPIGKADTIGQIGMLGANASDAAAVWASQQGSSQSSGGSIGGVVGIVMAAGILTLVWKLLPAEKPHRANPCRHCRGRR